MLRAAFNKYPIVMNSIFYGTLYVGAEFSQQTVQRKLLTDKPKEYDWPQLRRYFMVGSCALSPTMTLWYKWLDKKFVEKSLKVISKKLLLDQFILTPPLLVMFFVGMSLMEGKKDIFEDCKRKFVSTFEKSCMFWLPAQSINFMFVPPTFRVVYIGSCAFIWVNILCIIKRQN